MLGLAIADPGTKRTSPLSYSLTLAVYCTTWTFFGSIERATTGGFDFLAIYVGPILVFTLGRGLVAKMVRVAKQQNSVSIADFIAGRYGKSQAVAALVAVAAFVGIVPYVALQLKAVTRSFQALTGASWQGGLPATGPLGDTALLVSGVMAVFAILFGVRSIQGNEHHRGLMRAVAFESLVKLAVFLVVGCWITLSLPEGFLSFIGGVEQHPIIRELFWPPVVHAQWLSEALLGGLAILCLPRQFHVAIVENTDESYVRSTWIFPAYLVAINIFVAPVAIVGLITSGGQLTQADQLLVLEPLRSGAPLLAILAFIGGLSAATSMIIVAALTLSTMICNDVVMPVVLWLRPVKTERPMEEVSLLLSIRRIAVCVILGSAYLYHRTIGASHALSSTGLFRSRPWPNLARLCWVVCSGGGATGPARYGASAAGSRSGSIH